MYVYAVQLVCAVLCVVAMTTAQYSSGQGLSAYAELLEVTENKTALDRYPIDEHGNCPLVGKLASLVVYNGRCALVLSRHLCEVPEHWLVISEETGKPECQLQVCQNGAFMFEGQCRAPAELQTLCPASMQMVVNEWGEGECDCPYTLVHHAPSNGCYEPYTRGPCERGSSLQKTDEEVPNPFECQTDICEEEGAVPITDSGRHLRPSRRGRWENFQCYNHWKGWKGPCPTGLSLYLDLVKKEVGCDVMDMGYVLKGSPYKYRPCTTGSFRGLTGCGRRIPRLSTSIRPKPKLKIRTKPRIKVTTKRKRPTGWG